MTLQTSGPISIIDLYNEFEPANLGSLSPPHSLSEFYSVAAGIPTSGTIDLADFYGASAVVPPTTVTVTEGRTAYTSQIVKNTFTIELCGYAANTEEAYNSTNSWPNSSIGSRSPATFNGVTIEALCKYNNYFIGSFPSFIIVLQGNRPQNFFTSILPQGSQLELASSSATYAYDATGNYTKWSWSDSYGDPQPPSFFGNADTFNNQWDGTGTSTVTITP